MEEISPYKGPYTNLLWNQVGESLRLTGVRIADTFMISNTFEITWLFFSNKQRSILKKVNNCDIKGVKNHFNNLSDFRRAQSELGQAAGILS